MKTTFLIFVFFVFHFNTKADIGKDPAEWGVFSKEELEMKVYPMDSTASAVILTKFGTVSFEIVGYDIKAVYYSLIRIKILNAAGFKYGDIEIPYIARKSTDRFIDLKAHTINIDANGKPHETMVNKDLILDEDINGYHHMKKFAFPDLHEGSIIEYYYKIKSDQVFILKDWYFQDDIPIAHCEYRTNIPNFYSYSILANGRNGINNIQHDNSFLIVGNMTTGVTERSDVDITKYTMENVKAIHKEIFSIHPPDYNSFKMQLNSINFPGSISKSILKDWKEFGEYLNEAEWYEDQFHSFNFAKELTQQLLNGITNEKEKISTLYNYVKNNFAWSENYSIYMDNLKTAFKNKTGNSSEINSILLCMLRSAGIKADPVMICTRNNGVALRAYTFLDQFNHTVVKVKSENEEYILDAIDPLKPMTLQNELNINIQGFALIDKNFEWIQINNASVSKSSQNFLLTLDKDDNINGKYIYSCNNYSALHGRKRIIQRGLKEFFSDFIDEKKLNIKSDSITVQNLDSLINNLIIKSNISSSVISSDKFIYLTPYINADLHTNPFKDEIRESPVEFTFPINDISTFNLKIPSGYKINEMPKSIKVTLPDSAASFTFITTSTDDQIQLKSVLTINKLFFPAEEYTEVRDFFAAISKKFSEQIVINKE